MEIGAKLKKPDLKKGLHRKRLQKKRVTLIDLRFKEKVSSIYVMDYLLFIKSFVFRAVHNNTSDGLYYVIPQIAVASFIHGCVLCRNGDNGTKPAYRDGNSFLVRPDKRTPGTQGGAKAKPAFR